MCVRRTSATERVGLGFRSPHGEAELTVGVERLFEACTPRRRLTSPTGLGRRDEGVDLSFDPPLQLPDRSRQRATGEPLAAQALHPRELDALEPLEVPNPRLLGEISRWNALEHPSFEGQRLESMSCVEDLGSGLDDAIDQDRDGAIMGQHRRLACQRAFSEASLRSGENDLK